MINALRARGHLAIDEAAREVIQEGVITPQTAEFQVEIFRRQLEREDHNPRAFFDRSALEGIAYSRKYLPSIPAEIMNFDFSGRYSAVFLLERLPFQNDGVRVEKDDTEAGEVHLEIIRAYVERGYNPVHVPIFPGEIKDSVERRIDHILSFIEKMKGGVN